MKYLVAYNDKVKSYTTLQEAQAKRLELHHQGVTAIILIKGSKCK